MKKPSLAAAALALAFPVAAQDEDASRLSNGVGDASLSQPIAQQETPPPGPSDIVNFAPSSEWVVIPPEDMLVMTLAPDSEGNERKVVIQLMPAPFSQGWVSNIKTLARAKWYDGISVNRVQDNYVVQWGDPGHDNPESGETETKPLPDGLKVMGEDEYATEITKELSSKMAATLLNGEASKGSGVGWTVYAPLKDGEASLDLEGSQKLAGDPYAVANVNFKGWPISLGRLEAAWPVHCYGMIGVGRSYSPDTGSGAELYTVIGHAPRHLDRNIALVGRIIGGMEHLSSLPRGSGALGFYTEEEKDKRTPILSVRVAADLPEDEQPLYEYLSTESESFAKYAEARANRRDPFFIVPAGGADICNIPVPIREFEYAEGDAE